METSPFRQGFAHIPDIGVFFPLDKAPSTLEIDPLPRTSFLVHHKSALGHGFTAPDDACCGLTLAAALLVALENSGEIGYSTSFMSGGSETATLVVRSF